MLRKFAAESIVIDAVNCHGNTNYAGTGLTSYDFFAETCRAKAPRGDAAFGSHVGAYSFAEIRDRFGLRYWLELAAQRRWPPDPRVSPTSRITRRR